MIPKRIYDSANKKMGVTTNDFNGYDFDNPKTRKRMKYIIIKEGDLDLNGAYAFKSEKEVAEYFNEMPANRLVIKKELKWNIRIGY